MTSSSKTATAPESQAQRARRLIDELSALIKEPAPPPTGGLYLDGLTCRQLEDQLGVGATLSPTHLVKAVDRLGTIKIGDIRIPFTPGQLSELQHRAQKRGRTVEAEMRAVVARIEEEIFYKGG